ncbi:MAG: SUMF1/EgtB/PvdO family nonheme iron enzyme [Candidatus Hydrogenedentes bacterium]|nr:SUMF1/EgtB/PvdO family nonheme iron enzyme [Candidatus Hydrogenedentota bacterium]
MSVSQAAASAGDATTGFDREFNRWTMLVDQAKQVPREAETNEPMRAVLDDANRRWEVAQEQALHKDPKALDSARQALQCYAALKAWPFGMQFVPPGDVTLRDDTGSSVVTLDGFFIDANEVTNGQYLQFCRDNNWRFPPYDLETAPADHPVISVTFYDALAYAAWVKKQLPTEAQWARAAYGGPGASEMYPWGDDWKDGAGNSGGASPESEYARAVGVFPEDKSWTGCLDMAGNVAEWTRSMFKPLPYDPKDGREDVRAFAFGTSIVVRGGHYRDAQHTPMNVRFALPFESTMDTLGFRCVKEIPNIPPR